MVVSILIMRRTFCILSVVIRTNLISKSAKLKYPKIAPERSQTGLLVSNKFQFCNSPLPSFLSAHTLMLARLNVISLLHTYRTKLYNE